MTKKEFAAICPPSLWRQFWSEWDACKIANPDWKSENDPPFRAIMAKYRALAAALDCRILTPAEDTDMHAYSLTCFIPLTVLTAACEARDCPGTTIDHNVCLVGDNLEQFETPFNVEIEAAITTYAAWANLSPTAMRDALVRLNVHVHLEPQCKVCAAGDTVAITIIKPKSRIVDVYIDTWAAPWVFGVANNCFQSTSIAHEFLHVLRYIHLVILTDGYEQFMFEIRAQEGHPAEVFFGMDSPESIVRAARVESECTK